MTEAGFAPSTASGGCALDPVRRGWQQHRMGAIAFSSEVDTGSREENASKQKTRARF